MVRKLSKGNGGSLPDPDYNRRFWKRKEKNGNLLKFVEFFTFLREKGEIWLAFCRNAPNALALVNQAKHPKQEQKWLKTAI
jgi:hypothetical protein